MTADKIVSIVDRSVARIIREHYSDPDTGIAVLRRYHPGATKKEILAAFDEIDEATVLRRWTKELFDLCTKPGGADLKGLFEFISATATEPPSDDLWNILEMMVPPEQVVWLKRQLETSRDRRDRLQHSPAKSLTPQRLDDDGNT